MHLSHDLFLTQAIDTARWPGIQFVIAHGLLRLVSAPQLRGMPLSPTTWSCLVSAMQLCAQPTSCSRYRTFLFAVLEDARLCLLTNLSSSSL